MVIIVVFFLHLLGVWLSITTSVADDDDDGHTGGEFLATW